MSNKNLFINGYLDRISSQFRQNTDETKNRNLAFEIFSIAAILDKPFQEVFDNIIIKGDKDGGFDGIWIRTTINQIASEDQSALSPSPIALWVDKA